MANVANDPNGRKRIQFVAGDGSRKTIRLGKATSRQAEAFKVRVEQLIQASAGGTGLLDNEISNWLMSLDDRLHARLAAVGLVAARGNRTVIGFVDDYIASRLVDTKPSTQLVYGHTRRCLMLHFGDRKLLRDVTPGDADGFRLFLSGQGLAINTIRRRIGIARQFFNAARRKRLIQENPFTGITAAVRANLQRFHFISNEDAQKVLDACPNAEWRLLFALSRFGGLRCPTEHLALRWSDVDWQRNRIRVTSCKTEHHEGGGSRVIPLFPELLPHLREVFEQAEPGSTFVITQSRHNSVNLRTRLMKIIRRAGLEPWPKLFQNLRSTRETELAERFPMHVVCRWIGNSQPVAAKHYLQVTDAHFAQAVDDKKAAQNPAQQPAVLPRAESQPDG